MLFFFYNILTFLNLNNFIKNNKITKPIILDNINNINNNFLKTYDNNLYLVDRFSLKDECLFYFSKRLKVYIHLEQIIYNTNIYHIGITFKSIFYSIRYDIGAIDINSINILNYKNKYKTLFWDYSNKTFDEVLEFEKNIDYDYIVGIYDCRHYVNELTKWACTIPTPIWKLYKLF